MCTKRFRFQRFLRGRRNATPAMAMANRDSIVKESEEVGKKNVTRNHEHKAFQSSAVYSRASE